MKYNVRLRDLLFYRLDSVGVLHSTSSMQRNDNWKANFVVRIKTCAFVLVGEPVGYREHTADNTERYDSWMKVTA